jgi:hypothetical protein
MTINRRRLFGLALTLLTAPASAQPEAPKPDLAILESHVRSLCAPEFEGRSGRGGAKAAAWLASTFQRLGLAPVGGASYLHAIPGPLGTDGKAATIGTNVIGVLPGTDPALAGEYIMVTAHYDHLGIQGGRLYPGADDNASGVAMMLEVARCLAAAPVPPRRSILFVGFDLEEAGLFGSRAFVADPPIPLDKVRLFITADLIGRSLGGVCTEDVFVLGSEFSPGIRPLVRDAARGEAVRVNLLGSDILMIDRSDYGSFRAKNIPHLFFTTGENPSYHTPDDTPETLEYPKLHAITGVVHSLVAEAARRDDLPGWAPTSEPSMDEARGLHAVMTVLHERREDLRIPAFQARLLRNTVESLRKITVEERYSASQRNVTIRVAQLILATVL